ncbi:GD13293 [Drosophila simulans]|uniref:GD13293 n=1 Tax=Drosophila simulans TaxID=7240 RepID=B4QQ43_DROSI|nr:GD13293 [Drosophila simulans]
MASNRAAKSGFAAEAQRKASNFNKPSIGPKEADKNVRNFSDEQLRAGANVISLQYGSNKGATQSGINFGNTRHM